jgi:hypothetical protein
MTLLDLGPRARVAFAACWIAGQAALVLTAASRPDHVFGFRMFPESSTIDFRIERLVGGRWTPAPGGEWSATDAGGQLRHFSWRDRVRDPVIGAPDQERFASYGADTQLARLQRALDDVADHVPEDVQTQRLAAVAVVRRNGHEPATVRLESHPRGR